MRVRTSVASWSTARSSSPRRSTPASVIQAVYVELTADGRADDEVTAVADRAVSLGANRHDLAPGVLAGAVDTVTPHGIAAVAARPAPPADLASMLDRTGSGRHAAGPAAPVLVLAGVSDPGNAGTLVRSAEAAGARAVVATTGSVDLFAPKTVRASAGSLFRVPVVVDVDAGSALGTLHGAGFRILGTDASAPLAYDETDLAVPVALVLGNEAHGLAPALVASLDATVAIPMEGRVESLNVAMAGTLVLFEAARQRRTRPPV